MIQVELKPLFARLNVYSTKALENAAGQTLARAHYEISLEHLLRQLLEDPDADTTRILARFEIDPMRLRALLDEGLAQLKNGNPGRPVFAGLLTEWIQDAWLIASLVVGSGRIRGGSLLLALVSRLGYYSAGTRYGELLKPISTDALTAEFAQLLGGSSEGPLDSLQTGAASASLAGAGGNAPAAEDNIARFCEDLTAKAAAGRIDPIFGRDDEIRQMIDILARRRKNNPIAVGEHANIDTLGEFSSRGERGVKQLKGLQFRELFLWLSASMQVVSQSRPGAQAQLASTDGWSVVST